MLEQVKEQLNFQDIYKGCCTLKIEFSHTEALNVQFNSDDTKDYTNPSLPTRSGPSPGAMGNPGGAMGGMGHGPPGGYHMGGGAPRPPQGGYGQFGGYGQHPGHPGHHQQQHPMGASAGMPGMDPYGAHPPGASISSSHSRLTPSHPIAICGPPDVSTCVLCLLFTLPKHQPPHHV